MFDMAHLTELSAALEQSFIDKDIEAIQELCEENNEFIHSIRPLKDYLAGNEKIKQFILLHQMVVKLIYDVHAEMQKQLHKTNKTRKGVSQYKGVKNAE